MRRALAIAFSLLLSVASAGPLARADDLGTDESRAGMCDDFDGLPFVFCVAMCEARECDRLGADDERCGVLARGFATVTNGAAPPCGAPSGRGTI
jgi:hypothetical protein